MTTSVPEEVIEATLALTVDNAGVTTYRLTPAAKAALAEHLPGVVVTSEEYGETLTFANHTVKLMIDYDAMIADGEEWEEPLPEDLALQYTVLDNDEFGGDEAPRQQVLQALLLVVQDLANADVDMEGGKTRRRKTRKGKGKGKTRKGKGKGKGKGKKKTTRRRKH